MRSWGFLISRRWFLFALIVVLLTYLAWWLGEWQFGRLDDRKKSNAVIERNESLDPAPVAKILSPDEPVAAEEEWREITATGTYAADKTVIVRYQSNDGASGVDVVVPLVTSDGTALLVNRGWVASDNSGTKVEPPKPPTGTVRVTGWVRADGTGSSTTVTDLSTRAINSTEIGKAVDLPVYRGFVELDAEDPPAAERPDKVVLPELNNGPHFFYGLQWWFFGLMAAFGFGYLAWDERRKRLAGTWGQKRDQASD